MKKCIKVINQEISFWKQFTVIEVGIEEAPSEGGEVGSGGMEGAFLGTRELETSSVDSSVVVPA